MVSPRKVGIILLLASLFPGSRCFGQAAGIVRGTVVDETGAAVSGAVVTLINPLHPERKISTATGDDGTFTIYQVPFDHYDLLVSKEGFRPFRDDLDVHTTMVNRRFPLAVGTAKETVEVTDTLAEEDLVSTHTSLDSHEITRTAGAASSRGIENVLLSTTGMAADANGRVHVRGAHYQVQFSIDGLPVSDQISIDFGNPFDARNIEALEVYTGNIPAEYGNKVSGVVNISTKSGIGSGRKLMGSVSAGFGSFDTYEGAMQVGGGNNKFGYFISGAGGGSTRFLDPPSVDNWHNQGRNQSLFTRFDFTPNNNDFINFSVSGGRSRFQVPNLPSQQTASQDQSQELRDLALRFHWTHVLTPAWTLDAIPYYRTTDARLYGSQFDVPVTATQSRHLSSGGVKASTSYGKGIHRIKTGIDIFAFPVSEALSFAITDPGFNDPADPEANPNLVPFDLSRGGTAFQFRRQRTGKEFSFFAQDTISYKGLTATLGLRQDTYRFVIDDEAWSPRAGLAFHVPKTGTVLRASYNRLFQTPSNENLLLATSPEAGSLVPPERLAAFGAALFVVPPQRENVYEAGAQQSVKNFFRVDASYYWKRIRNYHDNDQFLNTTVVFPTALQRGRIEGFDLRVDVPQHFGLSGYMNFNTGKAIAAPPFTGGLFIGEEAQEVLEEGPFRIDHDQKYSFQAGITYEHQPSGAFTVLTARYDSGLVTGIEDVAEVAAEPDINRELLFVDPSQDPFRVRPRKVFDWSLGFEYPHEKPRWGVQFDIRNFTDERGAYNYLSVFSGTHLIAPRTFSGRVKLFF